MESASARVDAKCLKCALAFLVGMVALGTAACGGTETERTPPTTGADAGPVPLSAADRQLIREELRPAIAQWDRAGTPVFSGYVDFVEGRMSRRRWLVIARNQLPALRLAARRINAATGRLRHQELRSLLGPVAAGYRTEAFVTDRLFTAVSRGDHQVERAQLQALREVRDAQEGDVARLQRDGPRLLTAADMKLLE
jgi:hypothetical protein